MDFIKENKKVITFIIVLFSAWIWSIMSLVSQCLNNSKAKYIADNYPQVKDKYVLFMMDNSITDKELKELIKEAGIEEK